MSEAFEFAFQKGGVAGVIAFLAVVALLRVYKENRELVAERHAEKTAFHKEFTKAQVEWKDEVIKVKDACEAKLEKLWKELAQSQEAFRAEQISQKDADTAQVRDMARAKVQDSKLMRDAVRRIEALEEQRGRHTPKPLSGDEYDGGQG